MDDKLILVGKEALISVLRWRGHHIFYDDWLLFTLDTRRHHAHVAAHRRYHRPLASKPPLDQPSRKISGRRERILHTAGLGCLLQIILLFVALRVCLLCPGLDLPMRIKLLLKLEQLKMGPLELIWLFRNFLLALRRWARCKEFLAVLTIAFFDEVVIVGRATKRGNINAIGYRGRTHTASQ